MTGNAINAKGDELSSEQLDAVSGGFGYVFTAEYPPILPARAVIGSEDNVMGVVVVV